jgi:hypothetical protein
MKHFKTKKYSKNFSFFNFKYFRMKKQPFAVFANRGCHSSVPWGDNKRGDFFKQIQIALYVNLFELLGVPCEGEGTPSQKASIEKRIKPPPSSMPCCYFFSLSPRKP